MFLALLRTRFCFLGFGNLIFPQALLLSQSPLWSDILSEGNYNANSMLSIFFLKAH